MKSGETLIAEFENADDCRSWLKDRPQFIEVLGVTSSDVPHALQDELRKLMRPVDEEERVFEAKAEAKYQAELESFAEKEKERRAAELEAYKESMKTADPARPLQATWNREDGVKVSDPYDPREVTEAAREAVVAWVRERDTWVERRNQIVDSATVQVYPLDLPEDAESRVLHGGQFTVAMADPENN
jgi:hypothetical protein